MVDKDDSKSNDKCPTCNHIGYWHYGLGCHYNNRRKKCNCENMEFTYRNSKNKEITING